MREWVITFWLRIKCLLRRRQLDRDLREELSFHLAMRQEKYQTRSVKKVSLDPPASVK
jgi:hypothetical protein